MSIKENERKDVTIRNVDSELYDSFVSFAKMFGQSTGEFFDFLFRRINEPSGPFFKSLRKKIHKHEDRPEVIRGLEELIVTKIDLEEVQGKYEYHFCEIKRLVFDEAINGKLLSKTVRLIRRCEEVEFKGDVPELIKLGLIMKKPEYNYPNNPENLKSITIRNVTREIYDTFLAKSREVNKTTGEFFSEYIAFFIPAFDIHRTIHRIRRENEQFPLIIVNEDQLQISKKDLEEIEKKIIFHSINNLEFTEDVTEKIFEETIGQIIKCKHVFLPTSIPKLLALSRTEGSEVILGEEKIR